MKYIFSILIAISCILGNIATAETYQNEVCISDDRIYANGVSLSVCVLKYDEKNYIAVKDLNNIFNECDIKDTNNFYELKDDTFIKHGSIGSDNYKISKVLWHFSDSMNEFYCIDYSDNLFVPLREIAEIKNLLVTYNPSLQCVFINKPLTSYDYKCFDNLNDLTLLTNDIYEYSGETLYSQDKNGSRKTKSTCIYEWNTLINKCNTLLDIIPSDSYAFKWYYDKIYRLTDDIATYSEQMKEFYLSNSGNHNKYEIKMAMQETRGTLKSIIIVLNANIQALKDQL